MNRCAIYLRLGAHRQTVDDERTALERMVVARGYEPVLYAEAECAASKRPAFVRMLADARIGRIDAVAVWALDRLHTSMTSTVNTVLALDGLGVPVLSVQEAWLDTTGPLRPLLVEILGWVSAQERARLIERTKAGLATARAQGKRLGRPPTPPEVLRAAAALVARGTPVATAARAKGISRGALYRYLSETRSRTRPGMSVAPAI